MPVDYILSYRDPTDTAFLEFDAPLAPGRYRLRAAAPAADAAGNAMAAPLFSDFRVFSFADADGDGVPDDWEVALGLNPARADTNNNGIPDGKEDFDGDGLGNAGEIILGLDPRVRDTDGNGINDNAEDADGDGLSNAAEIALGTDPTRADTDGDGWPDGAEIDSGSDPLNPASRPNLTVTAAPSEITVVLPAAGALGGPSTSVFVATPYDLTLVASGPALIGGALPPITVATPADLSIVLSAAGVPGGGGALPAVTVATPFVALMLPSELPPTDSDPNALPPIHVATPTDLTLLLPAPATLPGQNAPSTIIAFPPVSLRLNQ